MAKRGSQPPVISPDKPVWYDPAAPLGSAVRYVASLSPRMEWVGIYLLKGKTLVLGPYLGAETPHRRIPVGKGLCGRAVREGRDLNVGDVNREAGYLACSAETRSELVVLIRDPKGKILGQLDIDSREAGEFPRELVEKVQTISRELGELWQE